MVFIVVAVVVVGLVSRPSLMVHLQWAVFFSFLSLALSLLYSQALFVCLFGTVFLSLSLSLNSIKPPSG